MRNNLKLDNIDDTKFKCKIYSHILKTMLNIEKRLYQTFKDVFQTSFQISHLQVPLKAFDDVIKSAA